MESKQTDGAYEAPKAYMWLQVAKEHDVLSDVPTTKAPYMVPQAIQMLDGYQDLNRYCNCDIGSIVRLPAVLAAIPEYVRKMHDIVSVDMWIDDEGLLKDRGVNVLASLLSGQYIVGSAVVMTTDSNGVDNPLPPGVYAMLERSCVIGVPPKPNQAAVLRAVESEFRSRGADYAKITFTMFGGDS